MDASSYEVGGKMWCTSCVLADRMAATQVKLPRFDTPPLEARGVGLNAREQGYLRG